jgi:hypothetical protein
MIYGFRVQASGKGFRSKMLGVKGQGWILHGTVYPRSCFL